MRILPELDHPLPAPASPAPRDAFPLDDPSAESGTSIATYCHLLWKRRWTILPIVLAVFLLFLFSTLRQQPTFLAKGTLEIEMPKSSVASLGELFQNQAVPDSYLQTQIAILSSSELASRVIDHLGLMASGSHDAPPNPMAPADFQRRLSVNVLKGTQLVEIGFDSESPVVAAQSANQLMNFYIDQVRDRRSAMSQSASTWLLDQLHQTKSKLEQDTLALQQYEIEHRLFFFETVGGVEQNVDSERLQQLQAELTRVQTARIEKESLHRQVQSGDLSILRSTLFDELLKKDAELAAQIASLSSKFGPNFPQMVQLQDELKQVRVTQEEERKRLLQKIFADFETSVRQEALVFQAFQKQQELVSSTSQQLLQDTFLKHEVDLDKQLYEGLLRQMNEAGVSARFDAPNARIFESAQIPAFPSRPRMSYNLILGALIGLTLGIGFVFTQEYLRDTFQTQEDVETSLNIPLLGVVPAAPLVRDAASSQSHPRFRVIIRLGSNGIGAVGPQVSEDWFRLDRSGPDQFVLSESIRNLRTSFLFALDGALPRSLLISSAVPSEGKTTISSNLSIALAQLGKRVLLVDADMRRPSVHKIFFGDAGTGLASYLEGRGDWQEFIRPSGVPCLDLIAGDERPLHPAELLSSARMEDFLHQAAMVYDVVILDSPILLNMADSRVLASYANAVALVVHSGHTPRKLVKQACANLRNIPGRVIGVVLNQVDTSGEDYAYGYSGNQEDTEDSEEKLSARRATA
ncbi:MAG: polysaccharide biosynthesis tyrosine autokinase [Candidatus Acidiferrales bacterium]